MKRMVLTWVLGSALALTSGGCFLFQTGGASTEGTIGGREIFLGGTVFAWWDTTVYERDGDGNLFRKTRDEVDERLHIQLYGFSFNPREDQRFWSTDQKLNFVNDMAMNDWLFFSVAQSGKVKDGTELDFDSDAPPNLAEIGDDPYLEEPAYNDSTPVRVTETNDYPETVKEWGQRGVFKLKLEKAPRDTGQEIKATFELKIEKAEGQEGDIATGSIKGQLTAPVINERIAECNFDTSGAGIDVNPCDDLERDGENL